MGQAYQAKSAREVKSLPQQVSAQTSLPITSMLRHRPSEVLPTANQKALSTRTSGTVEALLPELVLSSPGNQETTQACSMWSLGSSMHTGTRSAALWGFMQDCPR